MRLQRLVVGFLGAALLGAVPAVLTATSAQAGVVPLKTEVDATINAPAGGVYRYDQTIRFDGTVRRECTSGDTEYGCLPDAPDDSVTLFRQMKGSTRETLIATKDVAADGTFVFATASRGNAVYRIEYSGSASLGYEASAVSGLIKGSRNPRGKAVITRQGAFYRGNVDPGWGRKPVTIQRKACGADRCPWRSYKTVRTTRTGAYSVKIAVPRTGRLFWRSTVAPTSPRFVRAYGNPYYTSRARMVARMGTGR
jgi:hypothetical protein